MWGCVYAEHKRLGEVFSCSNVICPDPVYVSDEAEQVWVWEYETEEGAHDLYMDIGEDIRFRVVDETFIDTSPTGPSSADPSSPTDTVETQRKEAPYTLVVRAIILKVS